MRIHPKQSLLFSAALIGAALAPEVALAQTTCTAISVIDVPHVMVTGDTFTNYTNNPGPQEYYDATPDGNSCSTVNTATIKRGIVMVGRDAVFTFNRPVSRVFVYTQHQNPPGDVLTVAPSAIITPVGCSSYFQLDFATPTSTLTVKNLFSNDAGYSVMLADCITPQPPSRPGVLIDQSPGGLNAAEITAGVTVTITLPPDAKAGDILKIDTNKDGVPDHTITLTSSQITTGTVQVSVNPTHVPNTGDMLVTATITNAAGTSPQGSGGAKVDGIAPGAPIVTILDGGDGMLSPTEIAAGVTATITLPAGSVAGDIVRVDTDGNGQADTTVTLTDVQVAAGFITITVDPADIPPNGTLTVQSNIKDAFGNVGGVGSDSTITDGIAPGAPVIAFQDGDGYVTPAELLAGVNVLITLPAGTVAGDILYVDANGDGVPDYTVTITSSNVTTGTVTIVYQVRNPASEGTITLQGHIVDVAGNQGPNATDSTILDGVAPGAPVVTIDDGGDGILNESDTTGGVDVAIDLPADAKAGDVLQIDTNGVDGFEYTVTLTDTDITAGTYGILIAEGDVPAGSLTVTAHLVDHVGNSGPNGTDTATVECIPEPEICDGIDQDCDGNIDGLKTELGVYASACIDADNDGLSDYTEVFGTVPTDPTNPDTDGDGIQDGTEQGLTVPQSPKTDLEIFVADADPTTTTDPNDDDSDDDGLLDGTEDIDTNGKIDVDESDPNDVDSDTDGIQDGTESGLDAPEGLDTNVTVFVADADPTTVTDPLVNDTDTGTVNDGVEDANHNGKYEPDLDECDPNDSTDDLNCIDTDGDGLSDGFEGTNGTDPDDDDTDNDGLGDGTETNGDTDPTNPDTDGDGIQDGTEVGLTTPEGDDTDLTTFVADSDPTTTTDPLVADTDGDGLTDGEEDQNLDGAVGETETDPNNPDTDGGGINDGDEVDRGTDPLVEADDSPADPEQWIQGGCACDTSSTTPWLLLTLVAGLIARRRSNEAR